MSEVEVTTDFTSGSVQTFCIDMSVLSCAEAVKLFLRHNDATNYSSTSILVSPSPISPLALSIHGQ
jgi:hypothetical protein